MINEKVVEVQDFCKKRGVKSIVMGTYPISLQGFYWNGTDVDLWLDPSNSDKKFIIDLQLKFNFEYSKPYNNLECVVDDVIIQVLYGSHPSLSLVQNRFDEMFKGGIVVEGIFTANFKDCILQKLHGKREKDYRYVMSLVVDMIGQDYKIPWK